MKDRIFCIDCPMEWIDEEAARRHRVETRHATTHTVQPFLREHHPWLFKGEAKEGA